MTAPTTGSRGAALAALRDIADSQPAEQQPKPLTNVERTLVERAACDGGATHKELKEAICWNSECVTVLRRAAAKLGMRVVMEKEGRVVRYTARP